MAKKGQHKNDAHDPRKSPGRNNPTKSVTITTGTPKKRETYTAQAIAHQDPYKEAQAAKAEWKPDSRKHQPTPGEPRARPGDLAEQDEKTTYLPGGRQGPEEAPRHQGFSEAPSGPVLPGEQHPEEWRQDLNPAALAGQNRGPATA